MILPSGIASRSLAGDIHVRALAWSWFGDCMCLSKISRAIGTRPGCATHVPSWPSVASRSLSARTLPRAISFAFGSFLIGICGAMPPIANAPRLWQVLMHRSEYERRKCVVIVTTARSGSTKSARFANFLMKLKM